MATTINSPTRLQSYQSLLYARSLQQELPQSAQSHTIIHDLYTLHIAVMPGSHACIFTSVDGCATELVTDFPIGNPDLGLIDSLLCSAEKDTEQKIPRTKINYISAAQTEQLTPHIYNDTLNELDELAREENAITHRWKDQVGTCMSMVHVQEFAHQVHFQGYHLIASENLVIRTQSIFELIK